MEAKERLEEAYRYLFGLKIVKNQKAFAAKINKNEGDISNAINKGKAVKSALEATYETFNDIFDYEGLVNGNGSIFKNANQSNNSGSINNNTGGFVNSHINIATPADMKSEIIRNGEIKATYEPVPENNDSRHTIESLKQTISHLKSEIASKDREMEMMQKILESKDMEIASKNQEIERLQKSNETKDKNIEFLQSLVMKLHGSKS